MALAILSASHREERPCHALPTPSSTGLAGWGSYDEQYRKLPYWGMYGGDVVEHLRGKGYDCVAASVDPMGSAWDRACELYAQLAGTRVDYGAAHAAEYGHERFGRDFFSCPLIPTWSDDTRLVLISHSFGGATVRLLSELLTYGDEGERAATVPSDLSPLFAGGLGGRVHTVVALASPMNGTTAPESIEPGVWNVMPTLEADHMWPQGGRMRRHDVRGFYEGLLKVVDGQE